jgi:hypothetical protein
MSKIIKSASRRKDALSRSKFFLTVEDHENSPAIKKGEVILVDANFQDLTPGYYLVGGEGGSRILEFMRRVKDDLLFRSSGRLGAPTLAIQKGDVAIKGRVVYAGRKV